MPIDYVKRKLETIAPGSLVRYQGLRYILRGIPGTPELKLHRVDSTRKRVFAEVLANDLGRLLEEPLLGEGEAAERARKTLLCRLPKRDGGFYNRYRLSCYLGSDPEMFVENSAGELLPAFEYLPAKAKRKHIFWDGFQAEFTPAPQTCVELFTDGIGELMKNTLAHFPDNSQMVAGSTVKIPKEILKKASEDHVRLGCEPSYNIYQDSGQPVGDPRELTTRWAGGHLHFSLIRAAGQVNLANLPGLVEEIVKTLDLVLGVPGVLLANGWDDPDRRKHYGLAGEFRMPTHGIEYRTLSNFWLYHRSLAHLVGGMARAGIATALDGLRGNFKASEEQVREVINTCNTEGAVEIIQENEENYLDVLKTAYSWGHPMAKATLKYILDCQKLGGFAARHPERSQTARWNLERYWWSQWITNQNLA